VVEIFRLRHEGVTEKQLGETFGVTDVSAILNRKAWGHVTIPAEYQIDAITAKKIHRKNNGAAHRRFSDADIRLARKLYRDGISVAHISQRLGKSYSQTRKIVRREAHADVFDLVTEQRTAPRLNVLRGYTGNEPFSRTFSAPVTSGVTILSGQLISLSPSGTWVLGVLAGKEPFIAFADSVDTDVQSSGLLLGLSCAGQFEIETPWFDNSVAYVESSFLVAATGGSSVSNTSPGTAALGAITLGVASANADVIGYATNGGRLDATAINSQSAPYSLNVTPGNNATAANVIYLLRFRTQWFPHAEYSS
jgi:AraC-like DNA-binding protein